MSDGFPPFSKNPVGKAYKQLGLLRRTFANVNSTAEKKQLLDYLSLVRSQLMYCSLIWRPQLVNDILRLETSNLSTLTLLGLFVAILASYNTVVNRVWMI